MDISPKMSGAGKEKTDGADTVAGYRVSEPGRMRIFAARRIRSMEIWNYMVDNIWEIFSLVTGVIYVLLEVRQKNAMWILGMLTSAATVYVFFEQGLYASSALNVYYFVIAFWGLYQWRKDAGKLASLNGASSCEDGHDSIHLTRLPAATVWWSLAVVLFGTALLVSVMDLLEDSMSVMDASVAVLSAIATWWLGRSYLQQWFLWIAADVLTMAMCLSQGLYFMTVLYAAYTAVAVYGYFYWKRCGRYL